MQRGIRWKGSDMCDLYNSAEVEKAFDELHVPREEWGEVWLRLREAPEVGIISNPATDGEERGSE